MWCAVTPTVHFSAPVVFFQSASLSLSRRAVASSTLASNCLANASPLAPMVSSSLVCASLYRRTRRVEIDRPGNRPRSSLDVEGEQGDAGDPQQPASVVDRLVRRSPEIKADIRRTWGSPGALCHQNGDHVLPGVSQGHGRSRPFILSFNV